MIVVESHGSMWYLDDEVGVYRRTPKREGPRAAGSWPEPEPGDPLFDIEPHPMVTWTILLEWPTTSHVLAVLDAMHGDERDFMSRCLARGQRYAPDQFPMLMILVSNDGRIVSAPKAVLRSKT